MHQFMYDNYPNILIFCICIFHDIAGVDIHTYILWCPCLSVGAHEEAKC